MHLKLKDFLSSYPLASWVLMATLASGSGCAKLAYDPNASEGEAEKIKRAGVEVSPPSLNPPLILSPVGNPISPVSVGAEPEPAPTTETEEQTSPSAPAPEAKQDEQAPTESAPELSAGDSQSTTGSSGGESAGHSSGGSGRGQSSEHAAESGQEHADEHAAHQRSRVRISHAYSRTFRALIDLSTEEITAALPKLPYSSTREHPMVTLQIRRANESRVQPVPHVVNSQVIFGVDITDLPAAARLNRASEMTLSLSLTRISIRNRLDTELLCLIDIARCSGRAIQAASWQINKNSSFWSSPELVRSSTFADLKPGTDVPFTRSHAMNQGTIHLNLLEALGSDVLTEIRKIPLNRDGKRILLIAVSDDTLVHDAALTVSGEETSDITLADDRAGQP
jgi:hypothetical protein